MYTYLFICLYLCLDIMLFPGILYKGTSTLSQAMLNSSPLFYLFSSSLRSLLAEVLHFRVQL